MAAVLARGGRHKRVLREAVAARHDWVEVGRRLAAALTDLSG